MHVFQSSFEANAASFEQMKLSIEGNRKELLNCENYIYLAKRFHIIFSLNDSISNFIFNFSQNQIEEKIL